MTRAAIFAATAAIMLSSAAHAGEIRQRQERQHARIRQGVESGALTQKEAKTLNVEQRAVGRDRKAALADGSINRAERVQLTQEQNQASRDIYRLKHNQRTANQ